MMRALVYFIVLIAWSHAFSCENYSDQAQVIKDQIYELNKELREIEQEKLVCEQESKQELLENENSNQ